MSSSVTLSSSFWAMAAMSRPARTFFSASAWTWPWTFCEVFVRDALPGAARVLDELHLHHAALLLDERRRDVERVLLVELLDDLLGERGLGAVLEHLLERVCTSARSSTSVWKLPDVLRELVVERGKDALLDVLDGDVEASPVLPASSSRGCASGNLASTSNLSSIFLPSERRVELREDLPGPELELHALAAAVLHSLPVDREREVDGDHVALLGGARGLRRLEARVLLAEQLELLVDHRLGRDLGGGRTSSKPSYVDLGDLGLHLEARLVRERLGRLELARLDLRLVDRLDVLARSAPSGACR